MERKKDGILGYGRTPPITGMSSQQPEHCGLIGLLLTIYALCQVHDTTDDTIGIPVWIDNKEVLRRAKLKHLPHKFSKYSEPDFDLWSFTHALIQIIPVKIIL